MLSPLFSLLLLAFALSLDGFGVGVTYGLRKLKIPLLSIVIISLCSGIVICVSMQVGVLLARIVSPHAASEVGAVILLLMGGWSLIQTAMQKRDDGEAEGKPDEVKSARPEAEAEAAAETQAAAEAEGRSVFVLELRRLGIVIQILRTPSSADMDASGTISAKEAMVLGIALSLDAFGAGLGAALLGFQPVLTSLTIALFSGTFVVMGMNTGLRFAGTSWMQRASALPALLLIVMAIIKLL
ncbi:sporulation membrane protein YtaF [Paenibacillus spiritus]|uniref:Sporulation membrane protein YtaF n=1 Tax=Paenibacillus spiritus TaxID=2496557 RepID=A0A5J5FZF9_9BACL|nr:manganese efflux pump [Paenibacillus spiritus]KAA8999740.1 sporulation membrane protein YtaF [Paenibacillus spiritus]